MASSTNVGSIHLDLKMDTSDFDKKAESIKGKMSGIGNKMSSMGKNMSMKMTLPIVAGFGLMIKSASDLNETLNKVNVSFKDNADEVIKWSETSIQSMGLAQQSALDATALFGDMGTGMGQTTKTASDMSMKLTQLGADMASFKNVSFERAQTALAGIYTGETEALKGLGIVMTEANLEAFRMKSGIKKQIKDMTQAEKVQLRYNYVMEKTKNAQGDFARTSDGTANQTRMVGEQFKQLSASVGQKLLPIANKLLSWASKIADWFGKLSPKTQTIILAVAGLVAILGPLLVVLGSIATAFSALSILISPVTLIVLAFAGVAYLIYRNWSTLKPFFEKFWNFIKNNWKIIVTVLTGGVALLVMFFVAHWTKIKNVVMAVFNWVKDNWKLVATVLTGGLGGIVIFFATNWQKILDKVRSIFTTVKEAITNRFTQIKDFVGRIIEDIIQFFKDLPSKIADAVKSIGDIKVAGISIGDLVQNANPIGLGINAFDFVKDKLATGGSVQRGSSYLVGERGPELFTSNTSGKITANDKISGGGNTNFYGNINISDRPTADYWLSKMNRNQQLGNLGLSAS